MSYQKKPEDRARAASITMPKRTWAALDLMRGMAASSTFIADLVKKKWHIYLDEHPEIVAQFRREDPAMLLDYDLHRPAHPQPRRVAAPQHAFAAEKPAAYSVRRKSAA